MKNQEAKLLALAVVTSTAFMACNPLAKMIKRQGEVNYELTPNPVEMHGDSIAISINGSFPEKYFAKSDPDINQIKILEYHLTIL